MSATPRQKACNACADSKRRCDKQLPSCRRCAETGVDCVYPAAKRKRSQLPHPDAMPPVISDSGIDLASGMDWTGLLDTTLVPENTVISLDDMDFQTLPSVDFSIAASNQNPVLIDGVNDMRKSESCPWFLGEETWTLQHRNMPHDSLGAEFEMEPFIRAVEEMLRSWTTNGSNGFIHSRLYKRDMPPSVQDAFTTLAAYTNKTPATKETILRIAEDKATVLVSHQNSVVTNETSDTSMNAIRMDLARVHALFVYDFIMLFDGSVRLRALAEKQLPVLRAWAAQAQDSARRYRGEDLLLPTHGFSSGRDQDYDFTADLWVSWSIIESVRRTCLIVETTANTYETMTRGSAECRGAGMFTARRGLWEADSPVKWLQLSTAELPSPLLAPSLDPWSCLSECRAGDIDDFATVIWTCSVGAEKLQAWTERGVKMT